MREDTRSWRTLCEGRVLGRFLIWSFGLRRRRAIRGRSISRSLISHGGSDSPSSSCLPIPACSGFACVRHEAAAGGMHQYLIVDDEQRVRVKEALIYLASQPPDAARRD